MALKVIWMVGENEPDAAISAGLHRTECDMAVVRTISAAIAELRAAVGEDGEMPEQLLLIADVQAGAIPLLSLLAEQSTVGPATLLFDRDGSDIRNAIVAFRMGARDYLLGTDSDAMRERRAWVLAERIIHRQPDGGRAGRPATEFLWNDNTNVIRVGDEYVHLSPAEGRVFGLLHANRGHVVSTAALIEQAFMTQVDEHEGKRMLRVRMAYLRNKLSQHPALANLIINVRGQGYMLK
jgi:DNA-binding response OmpR family regulator